MTGPIDTIRGFLLERGTYVTEPADGTDPWTTQAADALTEVEQQLAAATPGGFPLSRERLIDRVVAAETAVAEANIRWQEQFESAIKWRQRAEAEAAYVTELREQMVSREKAAERRANELADTLREIATLLEEATGVTNASTDNQPLNIARAALDRHTHQETA